MATISTRDISETVNGRVTDSQPEPERAEVRRRENEPGERSASPDPVGHTQAAESHDFPYFEFYPYGYLY